MAKKKSVQQSVSEAGSEQRKKASKDIKEAAEDKRYYKGSMTWNRPSQAKLHAKGDAAAKSEVVARAARKDASSGIYKDASAGESMKAYAKKKEAPPKMAKKKEAPPKKAKKKEAPPKKAKKKSQ